MRVRPKTLRPLFRSLAALTLALFVVTQALCVLHCSFGNSGGEDRQASCDLGSPPHCGNCNSSAPAKQDSMPVSMCLMLKNGITTTVSFSMDHPDFSLLYTIPLVLLPLDATMSAPSALYSREAWPADRVFTPEVSLGPAHRSLAPPLLS